LVSVELRVPGLGAGQRQHRRRLLGCGPALDHGERHLGVELDAIDAAIVAERLGVECVVVREMDGAGRDLEGLPMPLIEHRGFLKIRRARRRRVDRMVADLDQAVGMGADPGAEHARDHLGAQANPEQRGSRG
jgi:hypothetical protein